MATCRLCTLAFAAIVNYGCAGDEHLPDSDGASQDLPETVDETTDSGAEEAHSGDTLRSRLGIPTDAARVLILGQSSHLASNDDWLSEAEEWSLAEQILSRILSTLQSTPDYRVAIAETFWLRRFWELHPDRHEAIRSFNKDGRLSIIGGGVSTPDVQLPLGDSLLRDYRVGAAWLRSVGLLRTSTAWLSDANGLGAATPDLLHSAGFDAVAFANIAGAAAVPPLPRSVDDYAKALPTPGSAAAQLTSSNQVDFLWTGPGGATIFAHWLSHGYAFGDHIDFARIDVWSPGEPIGPVATEREILDNLQAMANQILPRSPTDYGFIPVGGAFQFPKENLTKWIRAWNDERYSTTGIWAVAASFDDFAKLAMTQAERLQVHALDLSPYQMGVYASQEELKKEARLAAAALSQAESISAIANIEIDSAQWDRLTWTSSQTNHQRWITGISDDTELTAAQLEATRRLRVDAQALRDELLNSLADQASDDELIVVNTAHHRRNARVVLPWSRPDGPIEMVGSDSTQTYPGFVSGGTLHGTIRVPPLSAARLIVKSSTRTRPDMTVRCLRQAVIVPCDEADLIEVDQGEFSTVRFDRQKGGTLLDIIGTPDGSNLLTNAAFRFIEYLDGGNAATFGHELAESECGFTSLGEVVPDAPVRLDINSTPDFAVVAFSWDRQGVTWRRRYRVSAVQLDPLDVELTVGVAPGRAITATFETRIRGAVSMAVPGGIVTRPSHTHTSPTFWPVERWFVQTEANVATFGVIAPANPAVSYNEEGQLEVVLARGGGECSSSLSGQVREATLNMRIVSTYANDANGGVAATMDGLAHDLYDPLLAVRGNGEASGNINEGLFVSISTTSSDAPDFDWRIRVARFARTPGGYVLTLEKRMLVPRVLSVVLETRLPSGTLVEEIDAAEDQGRALAGVDARRFVIPMPLNYLTLRFTLPMGNSQ